MSGEEWLTDLKGRIANESQRLPEDSLKALLYHLIRIARGSHAVSWRKFIKFKICSYKKPREKVVAEVEEIFLKYQDEFNNYLDSNSINLPIQENSLQDGESNEQELDDEMLNSTENSPHYSLQQSIRRISVGNSRSIEIANRDGCDSSPSKCTSASSFSNEELNESYRMGKNEDVEVFIRRFNVISQSCGWSKEEHFLRLEKSLTGKAKDLYMRTKQDNYDKFISVLKRECMPKFNECRTRFFAEKDDQESYKKFIKRKKKVLRQWKRSCSMSTGDLFLLERLRTSLSRNKFHSILEQKPASAVEAAKLADCMQCC